MGKVEFCRTFETLLGRRPFQPFEVTLVHGERVTIRSPKFVAYRDGAAIYTDESKKFVMFHHVETAAIKVLRSRRP